MAFLSKVLAGEGGQKRSCVGIGALVMTLVLLLSVGPSAWADSEWSSVRPSASPEARHSHSMVRLSDGRIALFGGENPEGDLFNDLAIFDGNKWVPEIPTTSPKPLSGHTMSIPKGHILVFGGKDLVGNVSNDLYSCENQSWKQVVPDNAPPPPRTEHCAWTYDGNLYIAGGKGEDEQRLSDIWEFDPDTTRWQQGRNAPRTYDLWGAGAATYQNRAYFLGPNQDIPYFDYGPDGEFNTPDDRWGTVDVGTNVPPAKRFPAVTQLDSTAYMLGGYVEGYGASPCTWLFNLLTLMWKYLGPMPVPSQRAAAAPYDGGILFFGGLTNGVVNGKTYLYSR